MAVHRHNSLSVTTVGSSLDLEATVALTALTARPQNAQLRPDDLEARGTGLPGGCHRLAFGRPLGRTRVEEVPTKTAQTTLSFRTGAGLCGLIPLKWKCRPSHQTSSPALRPASLATADPSHAAGRAKSGRRRLRCWRRLTRSPPPGGHHGRSRAEWRRERQRSASRSRSAR